VYLLTIKSSFILYFASGLQLPNVMYRANAALALQKRQNRSSCRLGLWWESYITWTCTLAPPSKYGWTIVNGGYEWVCHQGSNAASSNITLHHVV